MKEGSQMEALSPNGMTTRGWDDKPLPRKGGPKGLLPSTWLGRGVKVEYADAGGAGTATSGTLLEVFPFGPILNVSGARTAFSWDRIALVELEED